MQNNLFIDKRGYNLGLNFCEKICEQFVSCSKKNVIRGIHKSPYGKKITILSGRAIDYIINFSTDPIEVHKNIMDVNGLNNLYIPPNFGHFWISMEDNTLMLYQLEGKYNPLIDQNINYLDPYVNLDFDKSINYIISDKDISASFIKPIDYIVLGSTGFLGSETIKYLKDQNKNFISLSTRLENSDQLRNQFILYKPKYVICAAGISGRPTIAWCEDNEKETYNINYLYMLNLAKICDDLKIHLTIYGSSIVYKDGIHNEEDEPDNDKYVYTRFRILLEKSLKIYKNILYLRIQYPVSFNGHPKCFMSKTLTRLNNINDQEINITLIPQLFPYISKLVENGHIGILNFVSPGTISIIKLLENYKMFRNNSIEYNVVKFPQTSGILDTTKLCNIFKELDDVNESVKTILRC